MANEKKGVHLLARIWGILPVLLMLAVLAVVLNLGLAMLEKKTRLEAGKISRVAEARPPVNVVVQELIPRPISERLSLPGMVEAWDDMDVLAEVQGRIVAAEVAEGDRVERGGRLVKIDQRDYENALASIRAAGELAETRRRRLRRLYEQDIVPRSEVDRIESEVDSLTAEMRNAELALSRCAVRAPYAGVVDRLYADEGQFVSVGDPVAKILAVDRLKFVVGVPEAEVEAVRQHTDFTVSVDALNHRVFRARKHFFALAPDSRARLYRLELAVPGDAGLLPGMFARVEIVKQSVNEALVIPIYSVISRQERNFVFVAEGGTARIREVKLGVLDEWRVQVVEGLSPGDRVIVMGHRSVDEGQKLHVARTVNGPDAI